MRALSQDYVQLKDQNKKALQSNVHELESFHTKWQAWAENVETISTNITVTFTAHDQAISDHQND